MYVCVEGSSIQGVKWAKSALVTNGIQKCAPLALNNCMPRFRDADGFAGQVHSGVVERLMEVSVTI